MTDPASSNPIDGEAYVPKNILLTGGAGMCIEDNNEQEILCA